MKKRIAAAVFLLAACVLALIPKTQAQAKEPVIVVIDPGHGGDQNRGGEVLPQYVEKNLTLQVAQSMKQTLEQFEGVQVYLTRTNDQELSLELTDAAKDQVIENGYDPVYGARPLKRYLQKYVETLAARKILSGDVHAGDTLVLDVQNGEFIVTVKDGN